MIESLLIEFGSGEMRADHSLHLFSGYSVCIFDTIWRSASLSNCFAIIIAQADLLLRYLYFWSLRQSIETVVISKFIINLRLLVIIIFVSIVYFILVACYLSILHRVVFIIILSKVIALLFIFYRNGLQFILELDFPQCLTVPFTEIIQFNKCILQ